MRKSWKNVKKNTMKMVLTFKWTFLKMELKFQHLDRDQVDLEG